jgi:hypothetical protein
MSNGVALDWGLGRASVTVPKVCWLWPKADARSVVWIDAPASNSQDARLGDTSGTTSEHRRQGTRRNIDREKTCSALELFLSLDRSERQKLEARPGPGRKPRTEREWLLQDIRTFIERFGPLRIQPNGRPAPSGVRGGLDASDPGRYPPDLAVILDAVERASFPIDKPHLAQLLAGTIVGPRRESLLYPGSGPSPVGRLAALGESGVEALIGALIEEKELSLVENDSRGWPVLQRVAEPWGFTDMGIPRADEPVPERAREYRAALAADRQKARAYHDALTEELQVVLANGRDKDVVEILRKRAISSVDEDQHVEAWYERWQPEIERELDPYLRAVQDKELRVCWEPIDAWLRYAAVTRAVINEADALSKACKQLPTVEESRKQFIEFVCQSWRPMLQPHYRDNLGDPNTWAVPEGCKWGAERAWDTIAMSRDDFGPKEALAVRRNRFAQIRDVLVDEAGLALYTTWTDDGTLSDTIGSRVGTMSAWGIVVAELHQVVKRPFRPRCSVCQRRYPTFDRTRVTRQLCCPHCFRVYRRKCQRAHHQDS